MNVVIPVHPAVVLDGCDFNSSKSAEQICAYMAYNKLVASITASGFTLRAVRAFAITTKQAEYRRRLDLLEGVHRECCSTIMAAVNTAVQHGGQKYRYLQKYKFELKAKGNNIYKVGKRTLKIKNTKLIEMCHILQNASVQEGGTLLETLRYISNVSFKARFKSSSCERADSAATRGRFAT